MDRFFDVGRAFGDGGSRLGLVIGEEAIVSTSCGMIPRMKKHKSCHGSKAVPFDAF